MTTPFAGSVLHEDEQLYPDVAHFLNESLDELGTTSRSIYAFCFLSGLDVNVEPLVNGWIAGLAGGHEWLGRLSKSDGRCAVLID